MARCLDIEYLWIDSLCIVQNDIADWEYESPKMRHVYGNAFVTFAAHGDELFLSKNAPQPIYDPLRPDDPPVYCRELMEHSYVFAPRPAPQHGSGELGACKSDCSLLGCCISGGPRRSLVRVQRTHGMRVHPDRLGQDQPEGSSIAALTRPTDTQHDRESQDLAWQLYIDICEDYTARGITFAGDTLPAVSSLMNRFSAQLGEYYAGLWGHRILLSLQWEAYKTSRCHRHETVCGTNVVLGFALRRCCLVHATGGDPGAGYAPLRRSSRSCLQASWR